MKMTLKPIFFLLASFSGVSPARAQADEFKDHICKFGNPYYGHLGQIYIEQIIDNKQEQEKTNGWVESANGNDRYPLFQYADAYKRESIYQDLFNARKLTLPYKSSSNQTFCLKIDNSLLKDDFLQIGSVTENNSVPNWALNKYCAPDQVEIHAYEGDGCYVLFRGQYSEVRRTEYGDAFYFFLGKMGLLNLELRAPKEEVLPPTQIEQEEMGPVQKPAPLPVLQEPIVLPEPIQDQNSKEAPKK